MLPLAFATEIQVALYAIRVLDVEWYAWAIGVRRPSVDPFIAHGANLPAAHWEQLLAWPTMMADTSGRGEPLTCERGSEAGQDSEQIAVLPPHNQGDLD